MGKILVLKNSSQKRRSVIVAILLLIEVYPFLFSLLTVPKNIHDKIKELVTPHIGQKHKFPGQVESAQNFEGILGVIDLHNIPGVFACLKVGATFVHVENARCWVLQFPGKANQDLNEQERVLGQMAEQIIAESLESFKSNSYLLNDRIPEEASAAVTKYYQPASL